MMMDEWTKINGINRTEQPPCGALKRLGSRLHKSRHSILAFIIWIIVGAVLGYFFGFAAAMCFAIGFYNGVSSVRIANNLSKDMQ
jgi:hypothetical protein